MDIVRKKQSGHSAGFTSPQTSDASPEVKQMISELQQKVLLLENQKQVIQKNETVEGVSVFDDSKLKKLINENTGDIKELWEVVGESKFQTFKVLKEYDDYLECHSVSKSGESQKIIRVAKPYNLRRTPFDGKTFRIASCDITYQYWSSYTRNAATRWGSESQRITVPYYEGEIITAYRYDSEVKYNEQRLKWEDINTGAKIWGLNYASEV